MTSTAPVLRGCDHLDITEYHEAAPLVAALKEVNPPDAGSPRAGFVWHLQLGDDGWAPTLVVGVRGEVGAVAWYDGDSELVPADGLNEYPTNGDDDTASGYWTWSGHESPMPPRSEIPINQVYAAAEEFVRTHERPTCLRWQPSEPN